jgi:hypothetical protein
MGDCLPECSSQSQRGICIYRGSQDPSCSRYEVIESANVRRLLDDPSTRRLRFRLDNKDVLTIDTLKGLLGLYGKVYDIRIDKDEVIEISRNEQGSA